MCFLKLNRFPLRRKWFFQCTPSNLCHSLRKVYTKELLVYSRTQYHIFSVLCKYGFLHLCTGAKIMPKGFLKERLQSSRKGELRQLLFDLLLPEASVKGGRAVIQGRRLRCFLETYIQSTQFSPHDDKTGVVVGKWGPFPQHLLQLLLVFVLGDFWLPFPQSTPIT